METVYTGLRGLMSRLPDDLVKHMYDITLETCHTQHGRSISDDIESIVSVIPREMQPGLLSFILKERLQRVMHPPRLPPPLDNGDRIDVWAAMVVVLRLERCMARSDIYTKLLAQLFDVMWHGTSNLYNGDSQPFLRVRLMRGFPGDSLFDLDAIVNRRGCTMAADDQAYDILDARTKAAVLRVAAGVPVEEDSEGAATINSLISATSQEVGSCTGIDSTTARRAALVIAIMIQSLTRLRIQLGGTTRRVRDWERLRCIIAIRDLARLSGGEWYLVSRTQVDDWINKGAPPEPIGQWADPTCLSDQERQGLAEDLRDCLNEAMLRDIMGTGRREGVAPGSLSSTTDTGVVF